MVRPERFELPTLWFVAKYSIQLSYGRTVWFQAKPCTEYQGFAGCANSPVGRIHRNRKILGKNQTRVELAERERRHANRRLAARGSGAQSVVSSQFTAK